MSRDTGVAADAAALPPSGLSRSASQAKPAAANAGHTPGPWAIRRGHSVVEIRTTAGLPIAQTTSDSYWQNFSDESYANACLMRAAPDLISALQQLLAIAGTPITRRQEAVFEQARAAISKARTTVEAGQ